MNFLLINYEYPPIGGGAGNATMFIARTLQRLGHSATVLTSAYAGNAGETEDTGVYIHRLEVHRRRADRASQREMLSFVVAATKAARGIADRRSVEAVLVFFALPCGPIALNLFRSMRLPYVVCSRGGDVPGVTPEIAWQHWMLTPLRRMVLRSARAIVAVDSELARLSSAADAFPVKVIPNGVDCEYFFPDSAPRPAPRRTMVLFVGRFHRQKNLLFFLKQFAQLHTAEPEGWQLGMAGDGDERGLLEASVQSFGLSRVTTWHGWQDDKIRLRRLYQQADVVVNPSLYEGLPNVVLEAMACGLPVVASDIPGNNSLVRPNQTGYLFRLGDGDALRLALQRVRADPESASRMGRNGRQIVEQQYSWDHITRRYVDLFTQS